MHLHEYQAKEILKEYQINFPPFQVIASLNELENALHSLQIEAGIIKGQIHAGGRGKAGGVKIAHDLPAFKQFTQELLGKKIINHQTGPEGILVEKLLISPLISFTKEYYLGLSIDRKQAAVVLLVSAEGGMEIEEIALKKPAALLKKQLPFKQAIEAKDLNQISQFLGWQDQLKAQGEFLIQQLVKAFFALDATLIEINPLVLSDHQLIALDAKISLDDNALFRHQELAKLFDLHQIPPLEARAYSQEMAYISLQGSIGCMVNGAGLAMATMDIIQYYGGQAANFLDIGGSATKEKIIQGFKIILDAPQVKCYLLIFLEEL